MMLFDGLKTETSLLYEINNLTRKKEIEKINKQIAKKIKTQRRHIKVLTDKSIKTDATLIRELARKNNEIALLGNFNLLSKEHEEILIHSLKDEFELIKRKLRQNIPVIPIGVKYKKEKGKFNVFLNIGEKLKLDGEQTKDSAERYRKKVENEIRRITTQSNK